MRAYADTNFFTSYYLEMKRGQSAQGLLDEIRITKSGHLPITWLTGFEVTNAFQLMVYFGRQEGNERITPEFAAASQARFDEDVFNGNMLRIAELPLLPLKRIYDNMVHRHTAKHGFRTYDVLHVASALMLGCDTFWSFDLKAKHLATLEGLVVNG